VTFGEVPDPDTDDRQPELVVIVAPKELAGRLRDAVEIAWSRELLAR